RRPRPRPESRRACQRGASTRWASSRGAPQDVARPHVASFFLRGPRAPLRTMSGVRRLASLLAVIAILAACATHPDGAYYPQPKDPRTVTLSHTLYRAAQAAGDDPERYSFALIQTDAVTAFAADDATFYFSEGLARRPQADIDALVAQKVAHEVLGHAGARRTLSLSVTAGFVVLGVVLPGLGLLDMLVNPLVVRAFSREQEIAADSRGVEILRAMARAAQRRRSRSTGSAHRASRSDRSQPGPSTPTRSSVTNPASRTSASSSCGRWKYAVVK